MHDVIFLVGAPGAGKTTALRMIALPSDVQTPDTEVRWTLSGPRALIGHYEDKILDGGDRVARHANLLCLEYWRRNILTNPRITATFLDGEMYLWSRILDSMLAGGREFVRHDEKNYLPGGRYHKTLTQIVNRDPERFPEPEGLSGGPLPEVRVSCIYLYVSPEVSLERRRAREASAEEGATINSDRHMRVAASKQRNFAQRFKDAETPFFMEEGDNPMNYLELNVEDMTPDEVVAAIEAYLDDLGC
jgi:thymidylate kinase